MKKILISKDPWETRAAITDNDRLQNVYFAPQATHSLERSYFKGYTTKILPGIQTAFVDIGQEKAGFLHISEIDRELALSRMSDTFGLDDDEHHQPKERQSSPRQRDISKILKEKEPILVQVSKEPIYEKGAKLTTCYTLPGRFIVLMPNIPRIGISKKIEDRDERLRLKTMLRDLLPQQMGCIIRTSSEGRSEKEIRHDLSYLLQQWEEISTNFKKAQIKEKIYEDIGLPLQIVRDHLDSDIDSVIVDDKETQYAIYNFVKDIAPEYTHKIKFYRSEQGLFEKYNLEKQITDALHKKVFLKSGGSIIIESAEAMTVVDVNTGKYTGSTDLEDTIYQTNVEAAEEVVRQLRLRNIGGLIVIDFIDMSSHHNRQKLYRHLEQTLKEKDKFQSVVLKVSEFGLVQMTRKRSGKTLVQQLTKTCECCEGVGFVKSTQTQCYQMLRHVKDELAKIKAADATLFVGPELFEYLNSIEYNAIIALEKEFKCTLMLVRDKNLIADQYKLINSKS